VLEHTSAIPRLSRKNSLVSQLSLHAIFSSMPDRRHKYKSYY
jgi:hypothetical protein